MTLGGALLVAICAFAAMIGSAAYAGRRFSRFAQVPAHFNFVGRATRLAPRRFVIWSTTGILAGVIAMIASFRSYCRRDMLTAIRTP